MNRHNQLEASLCIQDYDADFIDPIMHPGTEIGLTVDHISVTVQFLNDLTLDDTLNEEDRPVYPRTIGIEIGEDDVVKVHIYPFDKSEPVSIHVPLDGEFHLVMPDA